MMVVPAPGSIAVGWWRVVHTGIELLNEWLMPTWCPTSWLKVWSPKMTGNAPPTGITCDTPCALLALSHAEPPRARPPPDVPAGA